MIFHSLNVPGGSASAFLSLALALQKQGNTVDIYSYYFDKKKCFPELTKNLHIYSVKKSQTSYPSMNSTSIKNRLILGVDYYQRARKIFPLMKSSYYDIVWSSEACAYIPALMYKKKYNTPVFWSVFDPLSLVDSGRPGMFIHSHFWFKLLLQLHTVFDKKNINKIDEIVVPTSQIKNMMDNFYRINSQILPVAGVRIPEKYRDYRSLVIQRLLKLNFKKNSEIIMLSMGHFMPHRRYEDLIEAMRIITQTNKNVRLIISGSKNFDPLYFESIKKLIKLGKLDTYITLDPVFKTNNEVIGYYQYCDIFLDAAVEQTWGISPLEAMLAKKPVILSDGVGCTSFLTNDIHACIVHQRNPFEIASKLEKIISNKVYWKTLANQGYNNVVKNYSYEKIARILTNEFRSFLNKSSG